jgi:hypothetical protein
MDYGLTQVSEEEEVEDSYCQVLYNIDYLLLNIIYYFIDKNSFNLTLTT